MNWTLISAQEQDAWTHDYVAEILDAPCALGPTLKLGNAEAVWEEIDPGVALVHSKGGSLADRYLAEQLLVGKLRERGIDRAEFSFDPEHKTSDWNDIMDKAQRLIQSGNVTLLRNGYNNIVGHVIGDHGEYQTEIGRDDPNSRAITTWQCECPWDQFAWGRTRKWKKYEGRPCAHVLATFWSSQSAPLDDDATGENIPPGQRPPEPRPEGGPPVPGPETATPPPPEQQQLQIPFQEQGPVTPPAQPASPNVLPPFPGEENQLLPPGQLQPGQPGQSVSMPGARQPTPFNPMQNPSTYSKVAEVKAETLGNHPWQEGEFGKGFVLDDDRVLTWAAPDGPHHADMLEPWMNVKHYLEITPNGKYFAQDDEYGDSEGATWRFAADFENSDMVRLEEEEYGVLEGKSEEHGAGQYKLIPKGSIGEVLGQDPTLGWVDVIFAGPQAKAGPMEPYHIRAWIEPSKLTPMPNIQKPGPAVRRR